MNYNTKNFSKNLNKAISKQHTTIESVAAACCVSPHTVVNWMSNPNSLPSVANLYKLAKELDTTMDDLVKGAIKEETKEAGYGNKMKTSAQKILRFYDELPDGSLFTIGAITLRTGLTRGQISAAKMNIPAIAQLLTTTRISRSEYMKPYKRYDAVKSTHTCNRSFPLCCRGQAPANE